jgi:hypothetical protein
LFIPKFDAILIVFIIISSGVISFVAFRHLLTIVIILGLHLIIIDRIRFWVMMIDESFID